MDGIIFLSAQADLLKYYQKQTGRNGKCCTTQEHGNVTGYGFRVLWKYYGAKSEGTCYPRFNSVRQRWYMNLINIDTICYNIINKVDNILKF